MNQITMTEMLDHLEMERNHYLGEAADMTLRRPGFEDTPQDQLNIWIGDEEHKAKIVEAITEKLTVQYNEEMVAGVQKRLADIRETMKGGVMDKQFTLADVIQYLELWLQGTSDDIATFHREIESPAPMHDNERSQSHFNMLLAKTQHERECLNVVVAMLKEELGWEELEREVEAKAMAELGVANEVEVEDMLAAIRARRESMKGGV